MSENIYEYIREHTARSVILTREQIDGINWFEKRYGLDSSKSFALQSIIDYIGNFQNFILNRRSKIWSEEFGITESRFVIVLNWLRKYNFIKLTNTRKFDNNGMRLSYEYAPYNYDTIKELRHIFQNHNQFFVYKEDNNFDDTRYFYSMGLMIDSAYIQSIQQRINNHIIKTDLYYPIIHFTIKNSKKNLLELNGRGWSDYFNLKNEEHLTEDQIKLYKKTRQNQLSNVWNVDKKDILSFDVKSSIPRMAVAINTGKWLPRSIDVYELMFKNNTLMEFNKDTRKLFKKLFMYLAYTTLTPNEETSSQKENRRKLLLKIKRIINLHRTGLFDFESKTYIVRKDNDLSLLTEKITIEQVENLYDNMIKICGKISRNICVIESSIYICFIDKLIQLGYLQNGQIEFVFDSIEYTDKSLTLDICEDVLKDVVKHFFRHIANRKFKRLPFDLLKLANNIEKEISSNNNIIQSKKLTDLINQYSKHWNSTDKHFKCIFGNADKINEYAFSQYKSLFNLPKELRFSDLYFKARAHGESVAKILNSLILKDKTLRDIKEDKFSKGEDKYSKGEDKYSLKTNKVYINMLDIRNEIAEKFGENTFITKKLLMSYLTEKQWRTFSEYFLEKINYRKYKLKILK